MESSLKWNQLGEITKDTGTKTKFLKNCKKNCEKLARIARVKFGRGLCFQCCPHHFIQAHFPPLVLCLSSRGYILAANFGGTEVHNSVSRGHGIIVDIHHHVPKKITKKPGAPWGGMPAQTMQRRRVRFMQGPGRTHRRAWNGASASRTCKKYPAACCAKPLHGRSPAGSRASAARGVWPASGVSASASGDRASRAAKAAVARTAWQGWGRGTAPSGGEGHMIVAGQTMWLDHTNVHKNSRTGLYLEVQLPTR